MLICNCTLGGTQACKNCPTYIKEYGYTWDCSNIIWNYPITFRQGFDYDVDRYELVEKKDWKLNQLKKKLEEKKQSTDYYSKVIDKEIALLAEYQKEVEDLEKEIKELEQ